MLIAHTTLATGGCVLDNYLDNCHKGNNNKFWKVKYSTEVLKSIKGLPEKIRWAFNILASEFKAYGPYRVNWKNYGKFRGTKDCFHCHINAGRPRYVVCWNILDKKEKVIEVYYAGTHEKAPY